MAKWQLVVAWVAALFCVGLGAAGIGVTASNRRLEKRVLERQNVLGGSLLSQQGQQLTANVLQDMGQLAVQDPAMRALLSRHGLQLQTPPATNTASATPQGVTP